MRVSFERVDITDARMGPDPEARRAPPVVDEWEGGFGWIARPSEPLQRASHAIRSGDGLWLIEPVDAQGLDEVLSEFGAVAGVVVLLDRHARDAVEIARRHDVAVHVPAWMDRLADRIDAATERIDGELGETGFGIHRTVDLPLWHEAALIGDGGDTLVVGDALGTVDYFLAGSEPLAVHPLLRLAPPREAFGEFAPERVLVGHGTGVLADGAAALEPALATARWRAPRAYLGAFPSLLR